jgi:hypothetical protein
MPLDVARMRLRDAKWRIDRFIEINLDRWAEEEILQKAQKFAWEKGLSESTMAQMWIESERKGSKFIVDCVWDYRGPNDEPISKWLEHGTRGHQIIAKGKLLGGADVLRWYGKDGNPIFRPKVQHPGTQGMKIMERAKRDGFPALTKRIKREVQEMIRLTSIGRR